jgi:crotonobetainyl-CoA:carnitine CoA-transferase CaiB-like acyl-CoA transferase
MRCVMRACAVAVAVLGVVALAVALAADQSYEVLDKGKVYYGDCASFDKPAVVSADRIFPHIREIRLIKERKLNENDPEYWVLLQQANEVFRQALKKVAESNNHDLVVERGAIRPTAADKTIPDVTRLVIAQVQAKPEGR